MYAPGHAPLTVRFTDQSTGIAPLTFAWDFNNDGISDSTQQNPSFTYSTAGTYTVRHTITNTAGSNVTVKTGYITVSTGTCCTNSSIFRGCAVRLCTPYRPFH